MAFYSVQEMLEAADKKQVALWEAVLLEHMKDQDTDRQQALSQMGKLWQVMQESSRRYSGRDRSNSGLVGGDGEKLEQAQATDRLMAGSFMGKVMAEAVKVGECNACMKRIVAAPTAGSCGVLPAVFIPLKEQKGVSDEKILQALFVAAGFGQVIGERAFLAGAAGGCQAEVGTASAMAAAALCHLQGGSPTECAYACSFALENLLGLVCDPVAGLVELPCVRRNVIGALNAVSCADMALAGMEDKIPCDEVIDAMREVGEALPSSLRETGKGGLAATPTATKLAENLWSEKK